MGQSAEMTEGQQIYVTYCAECHGPEGKGDGPLASRLAPKPGNLVSAATATKTDEELLRVIANGIPRTAMRPWNKYLSDDELDHVLAFIRSLVHFRPPALTPPPPED